MIVKNSRAQRRHDRARLKNKRYDHWGYGKQGWRQYCNHEHVEMSPAVQGMVVNTPTPCSCYMCGNPRRAPWAEDPLTMQERKAAAAFADGVTEYNDWCNLWYEYDIDDYWDDCGYVVQDPAEDWYLRWMYIKE